MFLEGTMDLIIIIIIIIIITDTVGSRFTTGLRSRIFGCNERG